MTTLAAAAPLLPIPPIKDAVDEVRRRAGAELDRLRRVARRRALERLVLLGAIGVALYFLLR